MIWWLVLVGLLISGGAWLVNAALTVRDHVARRRAEIDRHARAERALAAVDETLLEHRHARCGRCYLREMR